MADPTTVYDPSDHAVPVGDAQDAANLRLLIERKLSERPEAVTLVPVIPGSRRVIVIGEEYGFRFQDLGPENGGLLSITYLNRLEPSCTILVIGDQVWFDGWDGKRTWEWVVAQAKSLPLAPPCNKPFGLLLDGEVRAIVGTRASGWVTDTDGEASNSLDLAFLVYVLEGETRPDSLVYNGDIFEYMARVWAAIGSGELVRLELPDTLFLPEGDPLLLPTAVFAHGPEGGQYVQIVPAGTWVPVW